jgi:glycosyltransferase involved in cell wall biosynthesis
LSVAAVRTLRPLLLVDTIEVGGAGKVALESIRGLVRDGARVAVANFQYPGRPSAFDAAVRAAGAELVPLHQRSRLDGSCVAPLQRWAREGGINLVESHSFKAHLVARRLRDGLDVPWLAYAHGWTAETWRVRLYNVLERRLLRQPDHVCAVARPLADAIRAAGREGPMSVLPNGLDPSPDSVSPGERASARTRLGLGRDDLVAVAAGRLSLEKAFDLLIAAFGRVHAGEPRLRLLVAGEGPERPRLEAAIARAGLQDLVQLLGQVPDIRPILAAADLLVLPSRTEGLPNIVLEGLDAGLPVLATCVGALPELVHDGVTGWLVPRDDVEALARGLARAAATPNLAAMGELGRTRILPSFSARDRLQRLYAIYGALTAPASTGATLQGGEVAP